MTDKKLTDEEIIKNLKFCEDCSANINIDIIDLITRQQAEIERLKALAENGASAIDTNNRLVQRFAEIKSEAVKDFAARLKEKSDSRFDYSELVFEISEEDIDNLVKEMAGEDNA